MRQNTIFVLLGFTMIHGTEYDYEYSDQRSISLSIQRAECAKQLYRENPGIERVVVMKCCYESQEEVFGEIDCRIYGVEVLDEFYQTGDYVVENGDASGDTGSVAPNANLQEIVYAVVIFVLFGTCIIMALPGIGLYYAIYEWKWFGSKETRRSARETNP